MKHPLKMECRLIMLGFTAFNPTYRLAGYWIVGIILFVPDKAIPSL